MELRRMFWTSKTKVLLYVVFDGSNTWKNRFGTSLCSIFTQVWVEIIILAFLGGIEALGPEYCCWNNLDVNDKCYAFPKETEEKVAPGLD